MNRICEKLAVAAVASAAIGFPALSTAPAKAATFGLGTPETSLYIQFSGTVNFTSEVRGTMELDGLDTFQATYRYLFGGTSEEVRWEKKDLSSFFFYYSPESIYLDPQTSPYDPGIAPLAFRATNEQGEDLWMRTESRGISSTFCTHPQVLPLFVSRSEG